MRTVFVAHSHPAVRVGGGELAAYQLFQHMRRSGNDVRFVGLTSEEKDGPRVFGPNQNAVTFDEGDHCVRGFGMNSLTMEHGNIAREDWLVHFLLKLNPDVYHFHHFWKVGASAIRRLRKARPDAKMICTLHELLAICANHGQMVKAGTRELCYRAEPIACAGCFPGQSPMEFKLRRMRMMSMLDAFDALISPSDFLKQRFVDWGLPEDRIEVLENGLPTTPDFPMEDDAELAHKARRFAFFGQATPTKGLNILVEAARSIAATNPAMDIVVDVYGVTAEKFAKLYPSVEVGPFISFKGRYAPQDCVGLMRHYGWIVVPSVWWENSPLIIQEARAAGTPVLTSDIGGMAEKGRDMGAQFRVGDVSSLREQLLSLYGDVDILKAKKESMARPLFLDAYASRWTEIVEAIERPEAPVRLPQEPVSMKAWRETSYSAFVERAQATADLTIFQHIPKTAGSSLVTEIGRNIGGYRGININWDDVSENKSTRDLLASAVERFIAEYDPKDRRTASGHLLGPEVNRLMEAIPGARVITFLRDPVKRVISDYRYQCTPQHPPYKEFIERCPTIQDYLNGQGEMNKMWLFMVGEEDDIEAGLALAEEKYAFVGITELYDLSCNTLMLMHGHNVMPKYTVRVTQDRPENKVVEDDELRTLIASKNKKDVALYNHFRGLLEQHQKGWQNYRSFLGGDAANR